MNARFFQGVCAIALLIAIPVFTAVQAGAEEDDWRHGLSVYGDLKYKPDFKHFDYVDPNAPKGGSVRQAAIGTFDNFNPVVAGVKGTVATGIDLIYDSLMVPALDEVLSAYGLLAESVSYPDDFSFVTYRLRRGSEISRRHAGDAGRRDLLVQRVQDRTIPSSPPIISM